MWMLMEKELSKAYWQFIHKLSPNCG